MLNLRFILTTLFAAALSGSALADESKQRDDTFAVFPDIAGHAYFPKGREHYYTRYLAAMKEPSLMPNPKSADAFALRFTWLRSFHDPIAIRIWRDGAEYQIRAVRLAQQQDYSPGPVTKDTTRALTKEELSEIQRLTKAEEFWKPFNEQEELAMSGGNDGSQWIFERVNRQDYSMIDLWSPKTFSELPMIEKYKKAGIDVSKLRDFAVFVRTGLYLLKITQLTPDEDEIY